MKIVKSVKNSGNIGYTAVLILLVLIFTLAGATACSADSSGDPAGSDLDIDVDLSGQNTLIVYGEVNKILNEPDDYHGKRIRMSGPYYFSFVQDTGTRYNFVAVEPADACCIRVLEFKWESDDAFPDGFPSPMAMIEVVGVYDTYVENGVTYSYINIEDFRLL